MLTKINSISINGLEGELVEVEADISNGMPIFNIVGLADAAIQESKERVRTAIKNSGLQFPQTRITINLAPAHIRKKGPSFDLAIAIGILGNSIKYIGDFLKEGFFLGELALDGKLRPISSVLPSVIYAKEKGKKYIFIPEENCKEASLIPDIKIIGINNLKHAIRILTGEEKLCEFENSNYKEILNNKNDSNGIDFGDIIGQEQAKRALLIAAAGGHNILMEGPPGSGKTMLAKALSSILPKMELNEIIEVSKIYSIAGLLNKEKPLIIERPFRKIHHTASQISIVGGGRDSRPGEISLAHKGVLFLDEFLEFDSKLIETLRQPIEDGEITINRINASYKYPAKFMLVGALNPCPCGYLGDKEKSCICSQGSIEKYRKKLSGPILDRVDIFINVPRVKIEDFDTEKSKKTTSTEMFNKVESARKIQINRLKGTTKTYNSELTNKEIELYCNLGEKESEFIKNAVIKLDLSTRAYFRILKLARTIADIEQENDIKLPHIAEALSYRAK